MFEIFRLRSHYRLFALIPLPSLLDFLFAGLSPVSLLSSSWCSFERVCVTVRFQGGENLQEMSVHIGILKQGFPSRVACRIGYTASTLNDV